MKVEPLPLQHFERRDAECFYFRLGSNGWTFVFLEEKSGSFIIHSDYGDFAYSWPAQSRGEPSLKKFLASCSTDYIACKMDRSPEQPDLERTMEDIKARIIEYRRDGGDKHKSRAVFNWLEEYGTPDDLRDFYNNMPNDLSDILRCSLSEYVRYERPPSFFWLRDGLLPPILEKLKSLTEQEVA